jgi:hypothetical protein
MHRPPQPLPTWWSAPIAGFICRKKKLSPAQKAFTAAPSTALQPWTATLLELSWPNPSSMLQNFVPEALTIVERRRHVFSAR